MINQIIPALRKGVAILALSLLLPSTAVADPVPTPSPAIQNTGVAVIQQTAATFVEDAYRQARLNSPFAMFDAEMANVPVVKESPLAGKILKYASKFLGTRYRIGASGPKAFDCSGFTSYVFRHAGIELDRSSRQQFLQGEKVNVKDMRPGDLIFFSSAGSGRGRVGHVGIVDSVDPETNTLRFIHASTKRGVVYQKFPDNGYYSRNFVGAKRVIE